MLSSSVNEIVATATVSFLFGWAFKNYRVLQIFKNFSNLTPKRTKLVIVVRSDLQMTKGKIAAQCSHASINCYIKGLKMCPGIVNQWKMVGQPKVVVRTDLGEDHLKSLAIKASSKGLVTAIIRDAGRTQVQTGTATVLGIGPGCSSTIDEVTSDLKLL